MPDDLLPSSSLLDPGGDITPGYYRAVVGDRYLAADTYVRVVQVERRGGTTPIIHYQHRQSGFTADAASFCAGFVPAPEGDAVLNAELATLFADIAAISQDLQGLHGSLSDSTVHVDGDGQAAGFEGVTALVPQGDGSARTTKRNLLRLRAIAEDQQALIQQKRVAVEAILAEKMAVATALIMPLRKLVAQLEESLWMVDLYLGRQEEIRCLQDGEAAPADTPIIIRQAVLEMASECAVAAEVGRNGCSGHRRLRSVADP